MLKFVLSPGSIGTHNFFHVLSFIQLKYSMKMLVADKYEMLV